MPGIKSPFLAILVLSLVCSTLPVPVKGETSHVAAKRAVVMHTALVAGDDSCDEPTERALFAGPLVETGQAFVADPAPVDDDDDQGDQVASAPVALDDAGLMQQYEPPASDTPPAPDVVIRGEKTLSAVFSRAGPAVGPVVPEEEPGKASLPLQGVRTEARGPGFEVESGRRLVGRNEPIATDKRSSTRPARPPDPATAAVSPRRFPDSLLAEAPAEVPATR